MRYTGPRGKAFSGDKAKAQSLQRVADLLVGRVIQRLKAPPFNGTGHLVDRQKLSDGTWVGCMVNMVGQQPVVRTWVESPVGTSEELIFKAKKFLDTNAGFLRLGYLDSTYLSPLIEYPVLYQSSRTSALHAKFGNKVPIIDQEPISYWYDRSDPPLHYDIALEDKINHTPLAATKSSGKMRLYQQARRGLQLIYPEAEIAPGGYSVGLWRDDNFVYWHVVVDHWSYTPSVTFTKFVLPAEYTPHLDKLKRAITEGDLDAELVCETNVLSYLELSTESSDQHTARIRDGAGAFWEPPAFHTYQEVTLNGGAWHIPSPVNGGWNFSWNGNKACIVLLEQVRASTPTFIFARWADITSHVLELSFSNIIENGVLTFSASVSSLEQSSWHYNHGWGYWFSSTASTSTGMWQIGEQVVTGSASHPQPTNAPLYGYYTGNTFKNNTLSLVRFTFSHEEVNERESTCANDAVYGFVNGGFESGFLDIKSGRHQQSAVTFHGTTLSGEKLPGNQHRTAAVGLEGAWTPLDVWFTEMDAPSAFSYTQTDSLCGRNANIYWWSFTKPSRYRVEKFLVDGCVSVIETNTTKVSSVSPVFFPHNVEAFALSKSSYTKTNTTTNTNCFHDTSVEWGGAAQRIKDIEQSDDGGKSWYKVSGSPNPGGDATYTYFAAQTSSNSSETTEGSTSGEIRLFGRYGVGPTINFVGSVDEILPTHYFNNFREILLPSWAVGLRISQGVGPEMGVRLVCRDGAYPVRDEYVFVTSSYKGYPPPLLTDPNAECIGFA